MVLQTMNMYSDETDRHWRPMGFNQDVLPNKSPSQITLPWLLADIPNILHEHSRQSPDGQRPLSAILQWRKPAPSLVCPWHKLLYRMMAVAPDPGSVNQHCNGLNIRIGSYRANELFFEAFRSSDWYCCGWWQHRYLLPGIELLVSDLNRRLFFPIIADRLINKVGYVWTVRGKSVVSWYNHKQLTATLQLSLWWSS